MAKETSLSRRRVLNAGQGYGRKTREEGAGLVGHSVDMASPLAREGRTGLGYRMAPVPAHAIGLRMRAAACGR